MLRLSLLGGAAACILAAGALAAESGVITGDVVNTRKGPGTNYERVELLAKGKAVSVLGEESGWYQIKWDNSTGYVLKDYVSLSNASAQAAAAAANATVTGGNTINVRSGPGTEYRRISMVAAGKRMAVLGQTDGWYQVAFDGKTGYINADYLIPDGAAAGESTPAPVAETAPAETAIPAEAGGNAAISGGNINVRSGPATSYSRIAILGSGKRVTVLAEEGGWFQISFDGRTGYILGDYCVPDEGVLSSLLAAEAAEQPELAITETPVPLASASASSVESNGTVPAPVEGNERPGVITGGTINVRTGPGTEYDRITKVSTGKRVTIVGDAGDWAMIRFGSTEGYVLGDYVIEGDSLPDNGGVGAQVAALAAEYLGVPYRYGGSSPSGFDCSGFAMYLYRQFGYSLPHTASGQYANCGYKVSKSELQPGDLVFFSSNGSGGSINHVGIYVGGGNVIHARYSIGKVYTNNLSETYYARNYVGAIRIAG